MNDPYKLLNDAIRGIYQRAMEDGLLRSAVRRVRLEKALDAIEADFIHWTEDTEFPQCVNNYVHNLGSEK